MLIIAVSSAISIMSVKLVLRSSEVVERFLSGQSETVRIQSAFLPNLAAFM